jgi:hypothetical protein
LNRLTTVSAVTFENWFESLEQETRQLQGFSRRRSPQDLELTLPFVNGADLVQKFNQVFDRSQTRNVAQANNAESKGATGLFPLTARIELTQQNALLAIRNHLDLWVDLTRLGMTTPEGDRLLDMDPLLRLNFYIETPWGVQWNTISTPSAASKGSTSSAVSTPSPVSTASTASKGSTGSIQGNRATHTLRSGEINHLTATFWIPSPVGIGALGILLLVMMGQRLLPKNDYV